MRFSRPILVFSCFWQNGQELLKQPPFFDAVVGWIYEQSFCRIDRTNKIRLHFFDLPGASGFIFSGSKRHS